MRVRCVRLDDLVTLVVYNLARPQPVLEAVDGPQFDFPRYFSADALALFPRFLLELAQRLVLEVAQVFDLTQHRLSELFLRLFFGVEH